MDIMHISGFVRGKGKFFPTQYVASQEKVTRKFPLLLTTGRILSQYNVGAQTRRTDNNLWHDEDRLDIHPHDAQERGIKDNDWVGIESRAGRTVLRARVSEAMQAGVVVNFGVAHASKAGGERSNFFHNIFGVRIVHFIA